jgi:hypothetical protein
LVTQLTAALHVGFLASRHNFLSLSLSCRRWSCSGSSLFISGRVIFVLTAFKPKL